jgi:hypothetical protein
MMKNKNRTDSNRRKKRGEESRRGPEGLIGERRRREEERSFCAAHRASQGRAGQGRGRSRHKGILRSSSLFSVPK